MLGFWSHRTPLIDTNALLECTCHDSLTNVFSHQAGNEGVHEDVSMPQIISLDCKFHSNNLHISYIMVSVKNDV